MGDTPKHSVFFFFLSIFVWKETKFKVVINDKKDAKVLILHKLL